jgi:hypothetical protein
MDPGSSKCRNDKGLIKKGKHNSSLKVTMQGPLYPWGNSPRYSLDSRFGGPQSRSGRCKEEKNPCPYQESNPRPSSQWPIPILTEVPQLPHSFIHSFINGSTALFLIWFVRLLALRPLLAYCASLG